MKIAVFTLLPGGLDQSILLAVLAGLIVLLFLTECYGWVFAGLVVPGYLASVYAMSFFAGVAVTVEAMLTFVIARFLSTVISRAGAGTQFFGRERFFLIVLASVVVRQNSELWLLPTVATQVDVWFDTTLEAERQLSSIGLVLVPLAANMFWKLDLRRGLVQLAVPTLLTYAVLTLLLLPYTNLSYASLELTYEDTALDFLASPKAYIIILATAYTASRFNLLYGWDYNGILVPALLALVWAEPLRIAVTVIEAIVLVYVVRAALLLPLLRTANLEGPRKIVTVFILGFGLKLLVSWIFGDDAPTGKVTDLFGFGYLLPSLLASKMLQKRALGRILVPALQVSLIGFVVASLIGLGLDAVAPKDSESIAEPPSTEVITTSPSTPLGLAMVAQARARLDTARAHPLTRTSHDLTRYRELWRLLARWVDRTPGQTPGPESRQRLDPCHDPLLEPACESAKLLGLSIRRLDDDGSSPAIALLETEETLYQQLGWDSAVLFPGRPGPILAVPRPHSERYIAAGAVTLCRRVACRAVIFSGVDSREARLSDGDVLASPRTGLHAAYRGLGRPAMVLLHAVTSTGTRPPGPPVAHIKGRLPDEFDLAALWPGELDIRWTAPPGESLPWEHWNNVIVIRFPEDRLGAMLAEPSRDITVPDRSLESHLARVMTAAEPALPTRPVVARAPVENPGDQPGDQTGDARPLPLPPSCLQRSSSDDRPRAQPRPFGDVADPGPLPGVARAANDRLSRLPETKHGFWRDRLGYVLVRAASQPADPLRLRRLAVLARLEGYDLVDLADCLGPGRGCWVLTPGARARPGAVALVLRTGPAKKLAIEAPSPTIEPGSWPMALDLWRRSRARALVLAVPIGRRDGAETHNARSYRGDLFHALHEAIDDAFHQGGLILQVRGYGSWRALNHELTISIGRPIFDAEELPASLGELLAPDEPLAHFRPVRLANGDSDIIALRGRENRQLVRTYRVGLNSMALLWFSQLARRPYIHKSASRHCAMLAHAGIAAIASEPDEFLLDGALPGPKAPSPALRARHDQLLETVREAASKRDVHRLRALAARAASDDTLFLAVVEGEETRRLFFAIELRGDGEVYRDVVQLGGGDGSSVAITPGTSDARVRVSAALWRRTAVITVHGRPAEAVR